MGRESNHTHWLSFLRPSQCPWSYARVSYNFSSGIQSSKNDDTINPLITGYEVIRFGVPMIGEYVNAGRSRTVTISSSVPGAQYRITAWALNSNGSRSATPAVVYATTGEASEHDRHKIHCTLNVSFFKIETCKPNAASTRAPHLDTCTTSTCTMVVFFLPSTNTNTIKGL